MTTTRSNHWSLTINNPTPADHEQIDIARQKGWKVTGQMEIGKEGTPHLQLHVATPQVRFSAVKKAFPRAHIEAARNPIALEAYVNKDDTRAYALPSSQEKYPSLSKFWQLVATLIKEFGWYDFEEERWTPLGYARHTGKETPPFGYDARAEFYSNVLDSCVETLIYDGYVVDHFYSPPNQNLWKRFHRAILHRADVQMAAQTERQTDSASESSAEIPMVEHNHAVCQEAPFATQA